MIHTETRNVRNAFAGLLLGLTIFTLAESALGYGMPERSEGLATCGTEAQPCTLEPVAVMAQPAPEPAAEGLVACGTAEEPCVLPAMSVRVEPGASRLASAERAPRMTLRVGS
ncbi:MAG TPA: hypothetical protein VFR37_18790 [Longimicrobium sp.]|nr:hypothetical protein [Longimicrobium sp.]